MIRTLYRICTQKPEVHLSELTAGILRRTTKVNRFLLKSKTDDIKNTMSNIEFAATAVIEEIHNSLNYTKESVQI